MIGATALGLVACVVLVFCVVAVLTTPGSAEEWGSAVFFVFFAFCGGIFGSIASFVGALCWIRVRGSEPWTLTTWIGVVLGLAFAIVIRFSNTLNFCVLGDLVMLWSGFALFVAAAATLGGFLGCIAGANRRASKQRKSEGLRT